MPGPRHKNVGIAPKVKVGKFGLAKWRRALTPRRVENSLDKEFGKEKRSAQRWSAWG